MCSFITLKNITEYNGKICYTRDDDDHRFTTPVSQSPDPATDQTETERMFIL